MQTDGDHHAEEEAEMKDSTPELLVWGFLALLGAIGLWGTWVQGWWK
jgi:hypothetical protein